jgi:hypothetical protein
VDGLVGDTDVPTGTVSCHSSGRKELIEGAVEDSRERLRSTEPSGSEGDRDLPGVGARQASAVVHAALTGDAGAFVGTLWEHQGNFPGSIDRTGSKSPECSEG